MIRLKNYNPVSFLILFFFLLASLVVAQDEDVKIIESEMVTITVSNELNPTFSWDLDIAIGRLLVVQGKREFWGTESDGENIYQSPIKYDTSPEGTPEPERAWPLKSGDTYTVKLFRWISVKPEKFQLMGEQEFTIPAELESKISEPEKQMWEDFDKDNFDNPTNIDNEWFPLKPGKQLIYEGSTIEKGESVAHRVVFTVTDLTKVIEGVRTVVCWDRDYSDGELVETEIVFYAQDNEGTVWHFGQYPEEYEGGKFVKAPTWIHGLEDAKAGIVMQANPQLDTPSYSQGWAPAVSWTDRGQVYKIGQKNTVPDGSFEDVLVIDETSREEPNAHQLKYYARDTGNISVGWSGDDKSKETLELIKKVQLDSAGMADVRTEVLKLEKNAYKISTDVYALTPPVSVFVPGKTEKKKR